MPIAKFLHISERGGQCFYLQAALCRLSNVGRFSARKSIHTPLKTLYGPKTYMRTESRYFCE